MKRIIVAAGAVAIAAVAFAGQASADPNASASGNGVSVSTVGPWRAPTGCSQYPLAYSGLADGDYAGIDVLTTGTRNNVGSSFVTTTAPRAGSTTVQICAGDGIPAQSLVLSVKLASGATIESAPFAWDPTLYVSRPVPSAWKCTKPAATVATERCRVVQRSTALSSSTARALAELKIRADALKRSIPIDSLKSTVRRSGGSYVVSTVVTYGRDTSG